MPFIFWYVVHGVRQRHGNRKSNDDRSVDGFLDLEFWKLSTVYILLDENDTRLIFGVIQIIFDCFSGTKSC